MDLLNKQLLLLLLLSSVLLLLLLLLVLVWVIARLVVVFGNNTASDISKYHEPLRRVIFGQFWNITSRYYFQIPRSTRAIICFYNIDRALRALSLFRNLCFIRV